MLTTFLIVYERTTGMVHSWVIPDRDSQLESWNINDNEEKLILSLSEIGDGSLETIQHLVYKKLNIEVEVIAKSEIIQESEDTITANIEYSS